jgi:hypothetical protein
MNRKASPFSQWPVADQSAWKAAMATGDRFDGRGAASHWSDASKNSISAAYGRWLGFLRQYSPLLLKQAPAERVTPDSIRAYIDQLNNEVAASTTHIYVDHLLCALRVMVPTHNWHWLKSVVRRLERDVIPKAKRHRMVDSELLFDLGITLMDRADLQPDANPLQKAILYRDGLLIAILAARPLRRRTLSAIRLNQHIHRQTPRTGNRSNITCRCYSPLISIVILGIFEDCSPMLNFMTGYGRPQKAIHCPQARCIAESYHGQKRLLVFRSIRIYLEIALQLRSRYENPNMFWWELACSAIPTCALSINITFMLKRSRQAMPINRRSESAGAVWLPGIPRGEKAWRNATTPTHQTEGCTVLSRHG